MLEHRLHHKYFGTEKDPFNPNLGILFAYFKNKCLSKHPDNEKLLNTVEVTDLLKDNIVTWQNR